ncbi:MAG: hypothetical protein JSS56_07520 [Proteobacteria bacterium]|nr:hypothetical protein [Pseudomonadota bacterium]
MSEKPNFFFDQFVPGFDFLKNLANGAAAGGAAASAAKAGMPGIPGIPGMPGISSWVAPTLSVEEVDKRIQELKAVQFWLDQNLHALKATIQALEVQRMTLSTLQGMNVQMGDLAKAFTGGASAAAKASAAASEPAKEKAKPRQEAPEPKEAAAGPEASGANKPAGGAAVDPMQLWGALTQQFQQIAATALKDAAQMKMPSVLAAKTKAPPPAAAKKRSAGTAAKKAPARKRAGSSTARRRSVL